MSDQFIYFLKPVGEEGPIKIGCSMRPEARLKTFMAWSPLPLEIICTVDGDLGLEDLVHHSFADLHSHSEWFHAAPRLLEAIEKLKAGAPLAEAVDLTANNGSIHSKRMKSVWTPEHARRRSYTSRINGACRRIQRELGKGFWEPTDVRRIMWAWSVTPSGVTPPTDDEIERLEEFLSAPVKHAEPMNLDAEDDAA